MTEIATISPADVTETPPGIVTPMEMIDRALSGGANIETLEKLMALQERWEANQARAEFSSAKALAMAAMPNVPKSGRNNHTNVSYSTLADIVSTTRPVLAEHGLTLSHTVEVDNGTKTITVTAVLAHANGYRETTALPLPFDAGAGRNAVQAIGSSQTYGQRYTAQAILGLSMVDESDDDGKAGGNPQTVSEEEAADLRNRLKNTGANEARFCRHMQIERLEDMPVRRWAEAIQMIDRAAQQRKGKAQ